jgi:predicted small secreted protein
MHAAASKPNGTQPNGKWWTGATKLALLLSVSMTLAACQTTSSTGTKSKCAGLKPITYSSSKDTAETVKQAKIHNAFGRKLGCW